MGKEFDEVLGAHEEFLATLAARCFLKAPELHGNLLAALRIVAQFCVQARGGPAPDMAEDEAFTKSLELRRLQREFTSTVRSVLRMVVSMHRQGMHTHLSQLLLRLDFNGYFSGLP